MWKNLKGYFIIEEQNGKAGPMKSSIPNRGGASEDADSGPNSANDAAPAHPPESAQGGEVNDRFVEVLLQSMERANLPGFDYLEFKKALQNLQKMNFDDATRFQTAYAAAQSMNVTPKNLVDSANHYLKALSAEQEKFQSALTKQRSEQIGGREEQLRSLDASIADQEAKIKSLQAQIAKSRERKRNLAATIDESRQKINSTAADFDKTFRTIAGSIEDDVSKMKQFLK